MGDTGTAIVSKCMFAHSLTNSGNWRPNWLRDVGRVGTRHPGRPCRHQRLRSNEGIRNTLTGILISKINLFKGHATTCYGWSLTNDVLLKAQHATYKNSRERQKEKSKSVESECLSEPAVAVTCRCCHHQHLHHRCRHLCGQLYKPPSQPSAASLLSKLWGISPVAVKAFVWHVGLMTIVFFMSAGDATQSIITCVKMRMRTSDCATNATVPVAEQPFSILGSLPVMVLYLSYCMPYCHSVTCAITFTTNLSLLHVSFFSISVVWFSKCCHCNCSLHLLLVFIADWPLLHCH